MARTSTASATAAKVAPALPAAARKKAKAGASPAKKTAGKKPLLAKAVTPKMAAARGKSTGLKGSPAKKAVLSSKPGSGKAGLGKASAKGKIAAPKLVLAKKSAAPKQSARKASPPVKPAKATAAKKIAARRPAARTAVPMPSARRVRAVAAPRKSPQAAAREVSPPAAPEAKASANPPQAFTVSHLNQDDFKTDGLRTYARYRDLGIAAATGGLCQAHVIRFTPPCTDEVRKRHTHQVNLQLVYVLQGWMKNEFEGHGEQMMSAGSCWLQPTGIKHTVLDYSSDCEVLEIIVPADFKTDELI
jgi:uncharacterized RmlC-like cupin family protein